MTQFVKDQKVAVIYTGGFEPRICESFVEKATKTKLTLRSLSGHVSSTVFNIVTTPDGKAEGRHARTSYMYWKEHVEIWGAEHDARIAERNAKMETAQQLNAIKDRVSKLHVSERDLIAKLAELLLKSEIGGV